MMQGVFASRAPRSLSSDRRAGVSILFAFSLVVLIGCSAVGVDIGSMFLAKRRLQGIADAAALATIGASNEHHAASAAVTASTSPGIRIVAVTDGSYTGDAAVAAETRFRPGATPADATRVTLEQDVPIYFARLLTGSSRTTISVSATATRRSTVAFSIGSRLAAVQGGLPNAILSGLIGTDIGLTVMDYNALLGANIDILSFTDALRTQLHLGTASFGDTLNTSATLPQILSAMASASNDPAVAAKLRAIAARVPGTSINLSQLIDLGPLADQDMPSASQAINVNTYAMLNVLLETASAGRQVTLDLAGSIPGLASTQLSLAIGERPGHSPWLSVTSDNDVVVRTAQARLFLQTTIGAGLGLGSLRVPLYVELAQAEARLADVRCTGDTSDRGVTLAVTPSVGEIALGDINQATLADFTSKQTPRSATLLSLPLVHVSALADITLGGTQAQSVFFTQSDIDAGLAKTVSTNDVVQGVAGSLANNVAIDVNVAGLGLNAALTKSAVATALTAAAPLLDGVIDQVTGVLGLHVGQADVWVNRLRCGTPSLVG